MLLRPAIKDDDNWLSKIIKYIPAEILAVYTAVIGVLKSTSNDKLPSGSNVSTYFVIFVIIIVLTPIWTYLAVWDNPNVKEPPSKRKRAIFHAAIATVAFLIWVYAIGDILFKSWLCDCHDPQTMDCFKTAGHDRYNSVIGSLALILFTGLVVPLLERIILGKPTAIKSAAGFTPASLGLNNVTGKFGEPRNGCPHKGTDFGSGGIAKDFKAATNGKVIAPIAGDWGTITVKPFHDPESTVQYLHCSSIHVKIGDDVSKDTVIGTTGKTAPPGTSISGIHLHLQVFKSEPPAEPCWNDGSNRNFYDPELWNTG